MQDRPHGPGVIKSLSSGKSKSVVFEDGVMLKGSHPQNKYQVFGGSDLEEANFHNTSAVRLKQFNYYLASEASLLKGRFKGLNLNSISKEEKHCISEITSIQHQFYILTKTLEENLKKLNQLLAANGLATNEKHSIDKGLGSFGGPAHSVDHASKSDSHRTSAYEKYVGDYINQMDEGNRRFSDLNVQHGMEIGADGKQNNPDITQSAVFAGQRVEARDRSSTEPMQAHEFTSPGAGEIEEKPPLSEEFWRQKLMALDFSRRGGDSARGGDVPPTNALPANKPDSNLGKQQANKTETEFDWRTTPAFKRDCSSTSPIRAAAGDRVDRLALEAYLFAFNGDIDEKIIIADHGSDRRAQLPRERIKHFREDHPKEEPENIMFTKASVLKSSRRKTPENSMNAGRPKSSADLLKTSRNSPRPREESYREDYAEHDLDFGGQSTPVPPRSKNVSMIADGDRQLNESHQKVGEKSAPSGNKPTQTSKSQPTSVPFLDELERMTEEISKIEVPEFEDQDINKETGERDYYSRPADQTINQDLSVLGLREYLNEEDPRKAGYPHRYKWNNESQLDGSSAAEKTIVKPIKKKPKQKKKSAQEPPKQVKERKDFQIDVQDADEAGQLPPQLPDTQQQQNPADIDRSLVTKGDFLRKKKKSEQPSIPPN